ncbi:MAG: class II fructose-bisphosphate aldolase [Clostridia bacterium]|nr:class II fructose-bisphosphate aldolase [Clostridia bacterium]
MSIVRELKEAKDIYAQAAERGWVLPCFCSENLTTTEAILTAASEYGEARGIRNMPVIVAITCNYSHRNQVMGYTTTGRWETGLRLFTNDIKTLAENGGPFEGLKVMIHLDHIQHDADIELLNGDLTDYASIMYDASVLPFEENIRKTAEFVARRGGEILIEGACDEIMDATGSEHNDLTTPENALRYAQDTGVDLIVANLGTEHRATGKQLQYHGDVAREIKAKVGSRVVLHGTSSVTNEQVKGLFSDGVCKVNIWTALERDSSPVLFRSMVDHAVEVAGAGCVSSLIEKGYLTQQCMTGSSPDIAYFTTKYRQGVVFDAMKAMVKAYFELWYGV